MFDKFTIHATPHIMDAICGCGQTMREVSNGLLSRALFCPKCESVYQLKLVKVPKKKVRPEYLKQAREDANAFGR